MNDRRPKNRPVAEVFGRMFVLTGIFIKYGLLTKCKVKMAGYWPSSFSACLWTETKSRSINWQKKKNEANSQPSWPIKLGK